MIDNKKYIVKDHPNLYRDGHSKAILSGDVTSLNEFRQKNKMVKDVEQNNLKMSKLEEEMFEIKQLLKTLINKV